MSKVVFLYRTEMKNAVSFLSFLYRDLQNNSISSIPPLAFRNLWRLLTLNLQHNYIRTLSNSSFYGLTNLSNLYVLHIN
jgi:Leucine-rich repeat (LRR) protein